MANIARSANYAGLKHPYFKESLHELQLERAQIALKYNAALDTLHTIPSILESPELEELLKLNFKNLKERLEILDKIIEFYEV